MAALHRAALWLAYRLMRIYWAAFHVQVHGALVTIWSGGEVLVLRNSYRRSWSLPGGGVHAGEGAREAARRELMEEIGLRVRSEELIPFLDLRLEWEGKSDHVELFELRPEARPELEIDHREVVEARFLPPDQALALDLIPPARHAIERGAARPKEL
jgi:8-oxo-dGTP pyrophosphatase MutT (NUDIX family)